LIIGVLNGVVDLRLGELIKPEPEMLITKQCKANYLKGSPCDLWLTFLSQIFNDQATIDSIQRIIGYTFTGSTTEEIIVICHGFGANGKSVLSNVLQKIAGDYGKTGSSNLLKARKDDDTGPRPDIASLCGARFVSVNEMQSGDYLDEQAVKILASREKISARHLYQNEFSYTPTAVIWLKTNHKPIIKGEDDGIWRRLILLPFERKFSEDERDRNLEEKLIAQSDGILEWIIEGAVKWYSSGLKLSTQIINQCAQYRTDSDLLGQFFEDEINIIANSRSLDSAVYYEYTRWCTNNGTRALAKKRFTQKLAERGVQVEKSNGKRYYSGIDLKNSLQEIMNTT
jgi:putative DNA primase/helicase